jgi:hypothetical protein
MSTGGFERVEPLGDGIIRGPARVLVAPYSTPYPKKLGSIINLATTGYTNEEQEITKLTKEPTTGIISFGFMSYETKELKYNELSSEDIQKALEELPSIGEEGVECEGTEGLDKNAITVKFAGELENHAQPLIVIAQNTLKKTAEEATSEIKRVQAGFGLYDPVGSWTELGSTKGGIKLTRNNTESMIDIDQIQAAILAIPDEWEMTVDAPLAQTSLENIQFAWEGGEITTDITQTPNERHLGLGNPSAYTERRMAILHKRTVGTSAGKIRGHLMRRVLKSPQASTLEYMKSGNQQTIAQTFRVFADPVVSDPDYSMGEVVDQVVYR